MDAISTIDELEAALGEMMLTGVQLNFGLSGSPLRKGQWFANTGSGDGAVQVRGPTLRETLNALLGRAEAVDVITDPVKKVTPPPAQPAAEKPASTSLSDLLA